ncbi:DNA glycosylase, partial [Protomyces lactucae-debilis]
MSRSPHPSSLHDLSAEEASTISTALQAWYLKEARVLPWRVPAVPFGTAPYTEHVQRVYLCLVSETMLQQTQVATVIEYFQRWMLRFPTIADVAEAPEADVLKLWAGLGYYSRAKRLQEACAYLQATYVAETLPFPNDVATWVKHVAGVGPYTAGAVLSIACGLSAPIVDGNVQRVLSRFLAIRGDTKTPKSAGSKLIWQQSALLVEQAGNQPGTFNQALMELGATVCTPVKPTCASCPVREECRAYRQYTQLKQASPFFKKRKAAVLELEIEDLPEPCPICPQEAIALPAGRDFIETHYPLKIAKKQQRLEHALVVVVRKGDQVYLERKQTGLLAGLFDFPS